MAQLTLGDGFTKRKQIQSEIDRWYKRLALSGVDTTEYTVKGDDLSEEKALPGSLRKLKRNFTIEESIENIERLIEEDKVLALRISLTNQKASADMIDLKGEKVVLTIPELIVLKNEIAPKLEQVQRQIPKQVNGNEIIEETKAFDRWRVVSPIQERKTIVTDKGHRVDQNIIVGYQIKVVTDYGYEERTIFDEIDEIQAWQFRLKEAINQANKTPLIDL